MPLIAAIQTNSSDVIDYNLEVVAKYVESAKSEGAELVALPECFALMPKNQQQLLACAEMHGVGKIQDAVAQWARELGIWIIAGTLPLRSDDSNRAFNSLLIYDNTGANVARYDKIHLFNIDIAGGERHYESDYTMPGNTHVLQQTPVGLLGMTICYDIRFPELYRKLSSLGATCLVVPSAFTAFTGAAHWLPLLRARAIENVCHLIAPAQVGSHPNQRQTHGHSMVIDPWGDVIAQRKTDPGVLLAEIDLKKAAQIRAQLPCLTHRRTDLFN